MLNCPICGYSAIQVCVKKDRFDQNYQYVMCSNCKFLFDQDLVTNKDIASKKTGKLYGGSYFENIDSGWEARGNKTLKTVHLILKFFSIFRLGKDIKVLDYGAGNGYVTSKIDKRYDVFYYDKYEKPTFIGGYKILEKPEPADLVVAVELVEHFIDLEEWNFLADLKPKIFIFTTGLSDNIPEKEIVNWPYLNPDFGHTALYSSRALYLLGKKYGYIYLFYPNISCHIFLKNKFLSKINFVLFEYYAYNTLRTIKKILSWKIK